MPILEMKVPSPGESITEVEIATWLVSDGDWVDKDQTIAEVDSDKATLELPAEEAGIITLKAEEGDVVEVGGVVCHIDTDAKRPEGAGQKAEEKKEEKAAAKETETKKKEVVAEKVESSAEKLGNKSASPVASKMMSEHGIKPGQVNGTGAHGRITKKDVLSALSGGIDAGSAATGWGGTRDERREKMSSLRRKIADRLVSVKNETAMLTT
ncbi:MAG: dihydrolipoyllysine-residue succinyltransferase, partial [Flavobacteriales bacterium]|nr:dihydrolipoyllysine-residue succinyltransferase [Flavobacteriales bacterium]